MRITVYLGASEGSDPSLGQAVRELGRWIGQTGHTLVYGGSRTGLMGQLAHSALAAGAPVIGVETRFFVEEGVHCEELTRLIVAETMAERRTRMIELGEAFIAFPGGTGTLEEIAEVMCASAMGRLKAPVVLYDLNGYYQDLRRQLQKMVDMGLSDRARQAGIHFAGSLEEMAALLGEGEKAESGQ